MYNDIVPPFLVDCFADMGWDAYIAACLHRHANRRFMYPAIRAPHSRAASSPPRYCSTYPRIKSSSEVKYLVFCFNIDFSRI